MKRNLALATIASLGMVLSACGGGGGSGSAPPPPAAPAPPPADTTAPTVPAGATATAQSTTEILVSWTASTDVSGISGYRVFRDGGAAPVATVTATSYTDTGLAPATAYNYTVVAVDAAPTPNISAASTAVSATTLSPPPPPPPARISLATERVYPNLTLTAAHSLLRVPHDTTRWAVVQQDGHVVSFADTPAVSTTSNLLDISDRVVFRNVHGLLGLAFHPNYPTDGRAWVAYTHETSPDVIVLRISEFSTADGGLTLNPASEQIIFQMAQPGGHNNGGHLLFGPDGFLYMGMGDGGNDDSASGVAGNGQLTNNLLGKVLRIDVDGSANGRRYRIPAGNPFAANPVCNIDGSGTTDCPEIFAWGFRNPWRFTFDRQGGQLWLGDVGSHSREEVNRVVAGGNYGWRCVEGTLPTSLMCGTPSTPLSPPVAEYEHPLGQAVTGGYVYHGTAIPALVGRYVFADYSSQFIWSIPTDTAPTLTMTAANGWDSGANVASFAEDTNGELYLVDVRIGAIYRLVAGT